MVATIKTIQGGAKAVSRYFELLEEVSDYYGTNSHSEWLGKAASLLGLDGPVERQAFENLLTGRIPADGPWETWLESNAFPGTTSRSLSRSPYPSCGP